MGEAHRWPAALVRWPRWVRWLAWYLKGWWIWLWHPSVRKAVRTMHKAGPEASAKGMRIHAEERAAAERWHAECAKLREADIDWRPEQTLADAVLGPEAEAMERALDLVDERVDELTREMYEVCMDCDIPFGQGGVDWLAVCKTCRFVVCEVCRVSNHREVEGQIRCSGRLPPGNKAQ